ncbi:AAA family ATPase [Pseudoroseomonas globiformis]|uniref:AAA family ATPase n=1 Tax=Teichococcus globiformis TaxID=2307229 RepID=A0ABV7G7R3_9PROT
MKQAEGFRRIADFLGAAQRSAIEAENAPEKRKRLRTFPSREAAAWLGVTPRELRALYPEGATSPRARLSFEDLRICRERLARANPVSSRSVGKAASTAPCITFTNFKGGSAKTTSSVHFAQYLALSGYRVLFIDLDSQGSATAQFGLDPVEEVGRKECFTAWLDSPEAERVDAAALCRPTYWPSIDLVPASTALAEAEDRLSERAAAGGGQEPFYFDELAAFLAAVPRNYDVVVVDTRPDVNMLMTAALHAASGIIVPMRATMTDLASTGAFFAHLSDYIAAFRDAFGRELSLGFSRILLTDYDPGDRSQEALAALLREQFGDTVLNGAFLHSRIVGTAGFGKETLYEYEPTTDRAAYGRVIASVNEVNGQIEALIRQAGSRTTHRKRKSS